MSLKCCSNERNKVSLLSIHGCLNVTLIAVLARISKKIASPSVVRIYEWGLFVCQIFAKLFVTHVFMVGETDPLDVQLYVHRVVLHRLFSVKYHKRFEFLNKFSACFVTVTV